MAEKTTVTLTVKKDDAISDGKFVDGAFTYFKKGDKIEVADKDAAASLAAKGLAE